MPPYVNAEQAQNIVTCLRVGVELGASYLALESMMCLGFGENSWNTYGCNSSDHCGVFQLGSSWQGQHAYTDVSYWAAYAYKYGFYGFGGIIPLARSQPHVTPGYITNQCQGAYSNLAEGAAYYDQYQADAIWAIQAYYDTATHGAKPVVLGAPRPTQPAQPDFPPSLVMPPQSDVDPSPLIRNMFWQLGVHGARAQFNASVVVNAVLGTTYCDESGPH